jgi:gliding motility-associated-like protein
MLSCGYNLALKFIVMERIVLPIITSRNVFGKNEPFLKQLISKRIIDLFLIALSASAFAQSPCDSINHTITVNNPGCFGSANGAINLTMSGGAAPYAFSWNTTAGTEDLSGLTAGTYSVNISDQNGCLDSAAVVLTQPAPLTNSIISHDVFCNGGSTGYIITNVSGGTGPYTYNWSNGDQSANAALLSAGTYTLTVVDYHGCSLRDTIQIMQPDAISLTLTSPEPVVGYNVSVYLGNDGEIDLTVNGGIAPYTYAWSNGAVTQDLFNLTAGVYTVVVSDSNSCTATGTIALDQPLTIELPSGFSPNGDGHNDNFIVHGAEAYPDNVLSIFNRWGNIVYQKTGYTDQWNGNNNNGDQLPDGTYFAIMEIKSKELVLKGYVEMKRH